MPTLKINTVQTISVLDWNQFVEEVYGRPYDFRQQNECRSCRTYHLTVSEPTKDHEIHDFENDTVPEVVNSPKMGVNLKAWLARDPKQPLQGPGVFTALDLWWHRSFYPYVEIIAKDLLAKGFLPEGKYVIIIDW